VKPPSPSSACSDESSDEELWRDEMLAAADLVTPPPSKARQVTEMLAEKGLVENFYAINDFLQVNILANYGYGKANYNN
jgi:hypothetical protein